MLHRHRFLQWIFGLFLFVHAISTVAGAASHQSHELRYGDLARSSYPIFEEMLGELHHFDAATLPHQAKALRRLIGDAWYHLEIFAYAYPTGANDVLPELLVSLKRGYDRTGDFKDLFDRQLRQPAKFQLVPYDEVEVVRSRESVLDWRREILAPATLQAYQRYVRSPRSENVVARPKASLSRCYWGGVTEVPSQHRTGFQNLRVLMVALVDKVQRQYEPIDRIHELVEEQQHAALHAFRVQIRCVLLMIRYFPPLTSGIAGAGPIEDRLGDLVARYGELNDTIMALNTANSKRQPARAKGLRQSISRQWSEILKWQRKTRMDDQLEAYGNRLRLADQRTK